MEIVDVQVLKDGSYYRVDLINRRGTRYPIAMVKTSGEAEHIKEVEKNKIS